MKNRITMIWLSLLTVYCAFCTQDTHAVMKNVKANQEYTLEYMQKSVGILLKIKHLKVRRDGTLILPAEYAKDMVLMEPEKTSGKADDDKPNKS